MLMRRAMRNGGLSAEVSVELSPETAGGFEDAVAPLYAEGAHFINGRAIARQGSEVGEKGGARYAPFFEPRQALRTGMTGRVTA
jgi:hypothetical protein